MNFLQPGCTRTAYNVNVFNDLKIFLVLLSVYYLFACSVFRLTPDDSRLFPLPIASRLLPIPLPIFGPAQKYRAVFCAELLRPLVYGRTW